MALFVTSCDITSCDVIVKTYDVMDYTVNTVNIVYDSTLSKIIGNLR